ncbi:cupin-like domain-containing protein [Trichocoleus sp. FACHB-591]|uniref:cupin-like domain-containing protein n=1 Tax=Trichocoleus sp. FACHB-591 TaxID=2692872 RepID=UPI001684DF21|nr:cupin-like domain-containing protein [Trichocoleus sp. FACHB-591]MBD2097388.1 cupin-like domain-containing protein [Trichocoleus sp. FACHB-591]
MFTEKQLALNLDRTAIAQSPKFGNLVERAIETLEAMLSSEQLSVQERMNLAAKILELEQQKVIPQTSVASQADSSALNLSEPWKQWIIENKLRQVPDSVLVETMVREGIDAALATQAVSYIATEKTFQTESETLQRLRKLESILTIQRQLTQLSPNFSTIERRDRISREEFLEKYYATNTPVILTGMMADWPALSSWTPDFLKTNYGQAEVQIQFGRSSDPSYEINTNQYKRAIKLSEYVDMVVQGGESNDYYMVANNGNLEREDLKGLFKDFIMFPELLNPESTKGTVFFWFGPAGTVTPLHHDPMNLMMAQVYGRKRWRLISPAATPLVYNDIGVFSRVDLENIDYEKYPLFKDVQIIETVLEPGEVIFVPVGWWHQVKGLDVSISLSFTNFIFPNTYSHQNPHITSSTDISSTGKAAQSSQVASGQATFLAQQSNLVLNHGPLTNEIVESTNASYLVDEIFAGEPLIISFGFVSWDGLPQFDFYGRTKKLAQLAAKPINRILVRDLSNSWYQRGIPGLGHTVNEVVDSLKQLIVQIAPSKVIMIGQSMGGYAAIMFGQLLGADQIITFGPLSCLDSAQAIAMGDTRWLSIMEALETNPPSVRYFDLPTLCQTSPHTPDIRIFYGKKPDPETPGTVNLDNLHASRFNALPNCTIQAFEESGHAIVKYLVDHKLMDNLLLKTIF